MIEIFTRAWQQLLGRIGGPLSFRIVLQPTVVAIIAIRAGLRDARTAQPIFFWSLFTDPSNRRERISDCWKDIAKVFVIAILIDCVYQVLELRWLYPGQALVVATLLAPLPYLVIRGLVNRIARGRSRSSTSPPSIGSGLPRSPT